SEQAHGVACVVVRSSLEALLATGRPVLADGATGTNYFQMGLEAGEPPELWNVDHPERVQELHRAFVDAGSDVILTNTFGGNRHRLKLHRAEDRAFELNQAAAELAREVADAAPRPVVVAGSVGPTGELFAPLGALTEDDALDTFTEQIAGLKAGGADVAWIETMSAAEEIRAAAGAAIAVGMPYTATGSFDTAGRTMMGLHPANFADVFAGLDPPPLAIGANCGVGASDILVTLLEMADGHGAKHLISKGNCGVPRFHGADIVYSGTPDLMAVYAGLAVDGGAAIVGGCCGTSPDHVRAMRAALDTHTLAAPPSTQQIIERIGPLANASPETLEAQSARGRERRRTR
ncbi:MAG: 5-methyltetrahydrofolate--homocysteine methyltransferase, partial [Actinomycetota bacterium]|nr:5-methyltetrahydrofolate--homocysteine methyltransferase [Actinomycetota bacterium]